LLQGGVHEVKPRDNPSRLCRNLNIFPLEKPRKEAHSLSTEVSGRTDAAIARSSAATAGYLPASSSRLPISTSAGMTPGHSVLAPRNQRPCPISRAVWNVLPGM